MFNNCPGEQFLTSPQSLPIKERTFLWLVLNAQVYYFWNAEFTLISYIAYVFLWGMSMCYLSQKFKTYFSPEQKESEQCVVGMLEFFTNPERQTLAIRGMYVHGYSKINTFVGYIRKVILLEDKQFSLQVLVSLYVIMKFFTLFGDIGFFVVFFNWFVWNDKVAAVCTDLYSNVQKLIKKANQFVPIHIKQQ